VAEEKITTVSDVRKRPAMFVGGIDGTGVLNLLLELVANVTDQHLAGRCTRASIELASDGTITVEDDGPGFSAEGGDALPPLHELLTRYSFTPTVDAHSPHVHLGVGGLGLFIVNALSERFELRTVRRRYSLHRAHGIQRSASNDSAMAPSRSRCGCPT
jgi:DNA gyrase/topoisomerase IV subunit B